MYQPGKRPRAQDTQPRKRPAAWTPDFSDLPTHLPNTLPSSLPALPTPIVHPAGIAENRSPETKMAQTGEFQSPEFQSPAPQDPAPPTHTVKTDASAVKSDVKEPVFIEGTNITLQTEEDIAKWIAERRKNWPTRKNVEAKKSQAPERPQPKEPAKQAVCKFYARNKRCKFGAKCKNVHEASTSSGPMKTINGIAVAVPQRYTNEVSGAGSLFTKLVQRDLYVHENNIVIDFLEYLNQQGLLKSDESLA